MSLFYPHIFSLVKCGIFRLVVIILKNFNGSVFLFPELLLESFLSPIFNIPPLQFLCFLFLKFLDWSYDFFFVCMCVFFFFGSAIWEILPVSLPNLLLNIPVVLVHI